MIFSLEDKAVFFTFGQEIKSEFNFVPIIYFQIYIDHLNHLSPLFIVGHEIFLDCNTETLQNAA